MKILRVSFFSAMIFFFLWLTAKIVKDLHMIHMALEVQREINHLNNESDIRTDEKIDKILKIMTADKKDGGKVEHTNSPVYFGKEDRVR